MTRTVLVLVTLIFATAAGAAQHHGAGWSFIGDANAATLYPVAVGRIDNAGKLTTILPFSKLASYDHAHGGAADVDDRSYVVAILSNLNPGKLLRVDQNGTILQTFPVLTTPPPAGGFTPDVIVDQNGDYITVVGPNTAAHKPCLFKVNRTGVVSTVFKTTNVTYASTVLTDIDTGNFLLLDKPNRAVFSVTPDGGTVTSVGVFTQARYLGDQMAQHIATGDLYVGSWAVHGGVLFRMDRHGASTLFLPSGLYGAYGMHLDRSSASNPRMAIGSTSVDSGVFFMDLRTRTMITLFSSNTGFPLVYHKLFPAREVATLKTAPGKWDVKLHFANQGGTAFAVGLGMSGVRPGIGLPDGRRFSFNPDPLTPLSIDGRLGAVFTGNVGVLDLNGRATAKLDVSPYQVLKGLRVWMQALTLDPNAPLGIRTVPDPVLVVL